MATSKTFYLETFGCQMNVHDSEKVIGTLRHEGYAQVDTEAAADLILYNTCSIRDKAEQKVFNRLNDYKKLHASGKRFVVLGCVAQQEGERIFERAPYVSLVSGSASYRKLPEMLVRLEAGESRITGLDDRQTEETFETEFTARTNRHRGYITIIEGCDKFCAYCVVPYTRGKERSRTSTSVLAEARKLAEAGYTEIQLLGQNVNSYRDREGKYTFAELLAAVGQVPGIRRVRFTTSHPRDFTPDIVAAIDAVPTPVRPRSSAGAERIDAGAGGNAAGVQPRRIPAADRVDSSRAPADQHHHRHHRGLSGRDGGGLRADVEPAGRGRLRCGVCFQIFASAQHPCRFVVPTASRKRRRAVVCRCCSTASVKSKGLVTPGT